AITELSEEIGEEGARAILAVFLDETQARLSALDRLTAVGDRGAIEVEAHTLKGAAGTVGFMRVSLLAKRLELSARAGAPTDYAAQLTAISAAFAESCRDIEQRPLTGTARAA
ncbi:MAG: Hpt domain-containing protein, partial [Alphaproteobacteria bacterium]|nr:Hpt domain-containing protein [Alphaproteobacteria bacterium]